MDTSSQQGGADAGWRQFLNTARRLEELKRSQLAPHEQTMWSAHWDWLEKTCQAIERSSPHPITKAEFAAIFQFGLKFLRGYRSPFRYCLEIGGNAHKPRVVFALLPVITLRAKRHAKRVVYVAMSHQPWRALRDDFERQTGHSFDTATWSEVDPKSLSNCWVIADLDFPGGSATPTQENSAKQESVVSFLVASATTDILWLHDAEAVAAVAVPREGLESPEAAPKKPWWKFW